MGMFHSTSGKRFYKPHFVPVDFQIPKETLKKILLREDELRYSQEYLEKYDRAQQQRSLGKIRDVTVEIQTQALKEFGFWDMRGLTVLNNARFQYKDDPEMNKLTVYMKYDHSTEGDIAQQKVAPDAALVTLTVEEMNQLQKRYEGKAHFVYVYIEEAHADDEWPLSTTFCIKQHKTMEERLTAAKKLVGEFGSTIPVLVDSMANEFNTRYSVWPERFFVVGGDGEMLLAAYPTTEFGFDRSLISSTLESINGPGQETSLALVQEAKSA